MATTLSEQNGIMATEMEMRAGEDIDIGEDITPPLTPLSSALHDSLLSSHCHSCFSPLPPNPFPSLFTPNFPNNSHPLLSAASYCSPLCSASDSAIHVSSSEPHLLHLLQSRPSTYPHGDSSDLRAALRLLNSLPATTLPSSRIAGLLTNHHKLLHHHRHKIRDGARAMFLARKMLDENRTVSFDADILAPDGAVLEEAVLCLVLTNAVEVQDKTGRTLGISVYGPNFCWINHSCSPNACYRFLVSPPPTSPPSQAETPPLRIVPSVQSSDNVTQIESGVCSNNVLTKDFRCYDPRMVVRSIKRIKKGEEVTVTYTDLLQPKVMRQSELWSRYQFICCCRRCSASPLTHVDMALEEISAAKFNSFSMNLDTNIDRDKATQRLTEYIDDAIDDYLAMGDPESSCKRLEHVLTQGLCEKQSEYMEETSKLTYWLHPFHHLSLNAYTTLASAYKIRANDLSALCSDQDDRIMKAFDLSRTSAAYSLLLACATHHLFRYESSLVVSVANFWASAGESLLNLARSSVWSDLPMSNPYSTAKYRCPNCSLIEKFETYSLHGQDSVSSEFIDCATSFTQKVWNFLALDCQYLRMVNPIDFSWLGTKNYSNVGEVLSRSSGTKVGTGCGIEKSLFVSQAEGVSDEVRVCTFKLGVHCLLYGGYLGSICYGNSFLVCYVRNILNSKEKLLDPCP